MKKVMIAAFALLLLVVSVGAALGNWSPAIRINGQLRDFSPPAQVVNQRIMVPLRFVAEDGALQGSVLWDGAARQVGVTCLGRTFQFHIGAAGVLVDGQWYQLDSPPYIYQNRTYLPLRFFAENLGGVVVWDHARREVSIQFGEEGRPPPKVFAYYYWGGFHELKENAVLFTDVALRWFETNSRGELFYEYKDDYAQVLSYLRLQGIKTHASVVFMDREGLHGLLSDPGNRARLAAQLSHQAWQDGYDGVNIDFEFIPAEDGAHFSQFLRELKSALGPDKELSVAVFARTDRDNWPTAYDYPRIGDIADYVVVMCYDYHYKTTAAGPVAPLWWVEEVIQYMRGQACIPPDKLLIGMATYGYDWGPGVTTATVTGERLAQVASRYRLSAGYDAASDSPFYTYTDANQVRHQIWRENEMSLAKKTALVKRWGLGGISFWRIGNGFDDLYKVLQEQALQ